MLHSYVHAKDFGGIFWQTKRSMQHSPLDDMVHLLQKDRINRPVTDEPGLKRIVYLSIGDILPLLGGFPLKSPSHHVPVTPQVADVPVRVPETNNPFTRLTNFEPEGDADDEDIIHNDQPEVDGEHDTNLVLETEIPEDLYVGYSEHHVQSATLIQEKFRKKIGRRSMSTEQGLDGAIYRRTAEYHQYIREKMGYVLSEYKIRYQGPLPALLACMEVIEPLVAAQKKSFSKQLVSKHFRHQDLDEVGLGITRATYVILHSHLANANRMLQRGVQEDPTSSRAAGSSRTYASSSKR